MKITLDTKFGQINAGLTEGNSVYIQTKGYANTQHQSLVVRGVTYRVAFYCALNPRTGRIEAQAYHVSGNGVLFPSDTQQVNFYRLRACDFVTCWKNAKVPSAAAKLAILPEVEEAINKEFEARRDEFVKYWKGLQRAANIRKTERVKEKIAALKEEITKLEAELRELSE